MTYQAATQFVFNKIMAALARQNYEKSMADTLNDSTGPAHETCAYRGNDGRRCAVGCLITDQAYDPGFEGEDAYGVNDAVNLLAPGVLDIPEDVRTTLAWRPMDSVDFLRQLQIAHDRADSPQLMRRDLLRVGQKFGLEAPDVATQS